MAAPAQEQLQMLWPADAPPPEMRLPDGYKIRCYTDADEAAYIELMAKAGFEGWTPPRVKETLNKVLPDGFLLIVHRATGNLAATSMATHNPAPLHPYGGELGWVAGDPAHQGRGLGRAVCAAVLARFTRAGYHRIYLKTDDFRLPAIKIYLQLGFRPLLFAEGMAERWEAVKEKLASGPARHCAS